MDLPEDTYADSENEKLFHIPEHKWFYFKHGRKASNVEELKSALENMGEAEFRHHVNNEKNDFANWVEDVFGEEKLARNMREVSDREGIIILLDDFLEQKNEPPSPALAHAVHHRHSKKVIIPEEKKLDQEPEKEMPEKELSETEIKELVNEAMQVFDKPGAEKAEESKEENEEVISEEEAGETEETGKEEEEWEPEHRPELEIERPGMEKEHPRAQKEHHKFIVEEFIYGFILGLIFGLIMLGIILRLNIA